MRAVDGAICFNSSTHLPPSAESSTVKPVIFPAGRAKLAAKPLPIGSDTVTKTIGLVGISRARALTTGVV